MSSQLAQQMTKARVRRTVRIVWPFVAILALLLLLSNASLDTMSGLRAYVAAESLWSKAQKEAVDHLEQYARTGNEDAYGKYLSEIAVPLGDQQARIALEAATPDLSVARQGFRAGRNHPDDASGMIDLFRRFRNVGFMTKSIAIWAEADTHIAHLDAIARELHSAVKAAKTNSAEVQALLSRIHAIDQQLTPLEENLTATLSEASRQMAMMLMLANLAVAAALLYVAFRHARRLLCQEDAYEGALRVSEERLDYAVSGSNDGIWEWRLRDDELYFSPRCEGLLGHAPGTMRESVASFLRRIHPKDRKTVMLVLRERLARGDAFDLEFRIRMQDGAFRWFRTRGRADLGAEGKPERMAGALTDISDRKQAEALIFEEKEKAQVTLTSIADAVITVDTAARIEFLNPVAERLTGWRNDEARGNPLPMVFSIMDENTGVAVADPVAAALRDDCIVKSESNVMLRRRNDSPIAIDHSVAPMRDRMGSILGAVLVFHDMSRERQYATRLAHLASHDPLTGLLNRRGFEHRLSMALADGRQQEFNHAVLYLDLDQFKVVNDTCGHAAGDELLRQVSALLRPRLRENDTIARLGGDEFGVLLEHCPREPALRLAEGLRNAVSEFHFVWKSRSFKLGVSIGLVYLSDCPQTLASVLSAADSACYMAKDKGRNRVQVYSPESDEVALRQGEMEWVNRIHRALAEDRFCLYAQPVQRTQGNDASPPYTELLLRLRDEDNTLILPIEFIPAAERYHLMPAIDRWVITTAFATLARDFGSTGNLHSIGTCGINLSGASIGDDEFLDFVHSQFVHFKIPHSHICFEITETTAVTSLSKAAGFMAALRGLGCRFALDDFGVGVSSFRYLKHLPVDYVKIDGSFVKDMLKDPVGHAMVEAIHRIGHIMCKKTIAESVESRAILVALRTIGVDYAQGFGIAMPEPFGEPRRLRGFPLRVAAG